MHFIKGQNQRTFIVLGILMIKFAPLSGRLCIYSVKNVTNSVDQDQTTPTGAV